MPNRGIISAMKNTPQKDAAVATTATARAGKRFRVISALWKSKCHGIATAPMIPRSSPNMNDDLRVSIRRFCPCMRGDDHARHSKSPGRDVRCGSEPGANQRGDRLGDGRGASVAKPASGVDLPGGLPGCVDGKDAP